MGYTVSYDNRQKQPKIKKPPSKGKSLRWAALGAALLLWTALLPEGRAFLLRAFLPGDPAQTVMALETMVGALREGEGFRSAVETFCLVILEGSGAF